MLSISFSLQIQLLILISPWFTRTWMMISKLATNWVILLNSKWTSTVWYLLKELFNNVGPRLMASTDMTWLKTGESQISRKCFNQTIHFIKRYCCIFKVAGRQLCLLIEKFFIHLFLNLVFFWPIRLIRIHIKRG